MVFWGAHKAGKEALANLSGGLRLGTGLRLSQAQWRLAAATEGTRGKLPGLCGPCGSGLRL